MTGLQLSDSDAVCCATAAPATPQGVTLGADSEWLSGFVDKVLTDTVRKGKSSACRPFSPSRCFQARLCADLSCSHRSADHDKLSMVAIRSVGRFLGVLASGTVPGMAPGARSEVLQLIATEFTEMRRRNARPEHQLTVLEAVALGCPEAVVGPVLSVVNLATGEAPTPKLRSIALDVLGAAASARETGSRTRRLQHLDGIRATERHMFRWVRV